MSYEKAMKHWKNLKKYKKSQPMLFDAPSFKGSKSVWADVIECSCGYIRPKMFFVNGKCDVCQEQK